MDLNCERTELLINNFSFLKASNGSENERVNITTTILRNNSGQISTNMQEGESVILVITMTVSPFRYFKSHD